MAAVLSTWDTIWRSWKPAVDAWEQHKTAIASTRNDAEELGTVMVRAQKTIGNKYNEIVDPVGKGFAQGDGKFRQTIKDIEDAYLVNLCNLIRTHAEKQPSARRLDTSSPEAWEQDARRSISYALDQTLQALEEMSIRMGHQPSVSSSSHGPKWEGSLTDDNAAAVPYCKGALLLQDSKTNFTDIIIQSSSNQCHTCKFCFLEISDFRTGSIKYLLGDWGRIASCHILASPSLIQDRRAAYRCPGCSITGPVKIQLTVALINQHINCCPAFQEFMAKKVASRAILRTPSTYTSSIHKTDQIRPPPEKSFDQLPNRTQKSPTEVEDGVHGNYSRTNTMPIRPAPATQNPAIQLTESSSTAQTPTVPRKPRSQQSHPPSDFGSSAMNGLPGSFPGDNSLSTPGHRNTPATQRDHSYQTSVPPSGMRNPYNYPQQLSNDQPPSMPQRPAPPPPPPPPPPPQSPTPRRLVPSWSPVQSPQTSAFITPSTPTTGTNGVTDDKFTQLTALGLPPHDADCYLRRMHGDVQAAYNCYLDEREQQNQHPPQPQRNSTAGTTSPITPERQSGFSQYEAEAGGDDGISVSNLSTRSREKKSGTGRRRGLFG